MKPNIIYQIRVYTDGGEKIIELGQGVHFKKFPILTVKDGKRKKVIEVIINK